MRLAPVPLQKIKHPTRWAPPSWLLQLQKVDKWFTQSKKIQTDMIQEWMVGKKIPGGAKGVFAKAQQKAVLNHRPIAVKEFAH